MTADVKLYRAIEGLREVRSNIGCNAWSGPTEALADSLQSALERIIQALEAVHSDMERAEKERG